MTIKGLKKVQPNRAPSLVISGDVIRYVDGMQPGDYGMVIFRELFVSGNTVYGKVLDAYEQCREFSMPIAVFEQLRVAPLADTPHQDTAS